MALPEILLVFTFFVERPIRGKILLKVFGKGVRGRLPTVWGGVSVADRGDGLRQREPFLRKVFPDKYI